jgi:tRNA(Ile)-lysidine synthase
MSLISKVREIVERERLIEEGERVLVALSGGIDSTTLLFVLNEIRRTLPFDLAIAHVNHLLRGAESQRDEDFVVSLAEDLSLSCHVHRIDVRREAQRVGKSIQHAARDVRYSFLARTALEHNYQKIGVAHTLDDQVETFMLRILKGTGIRGLLAIPMKRDRIVRPLLETGRAEIEEYAKANSIPFVEDSSNEKVVYERNFLRKEILPLMEVLNPPFRQKILLLLKDLLAVNHMLDKKTEEFMNAEARAGEGEILFKIKNLIALDEEIRFRTMAKALDRLAPGFMPLREHMILIDKVLAGRRPNLTAVLPRGLTIRKEYDDLIVTNKVPNLPRTGIFPVSEGDNSLEEFGMNLYISTVFEEGNRSISQESTESLFDADKLGLMHVRVFKEGDRFVPLGMNSLVKVKNFFIGQKIPREERRRIPLLMSGDDIIWVIGHRIDDRYKVTEETGRVVRISVARTGCRTD